MHIFKQFTCFVYASTFAYTYTKAFANQISILYALHMFQSSHSTQVVRMLAKIVESGFTPTKCICLKVSEAFSTNPLFEYPTIMAFHENKFLSGILSNSSHAFSMLPHFGYMSTRVVATTKSDKIPTRTCTTYSKDLIFA